MKMRNAECRMQNVGAVCDRAVGGVCDGAVGGVYDPDFGGVAWASDAPARSALGQNAPSVACPWRIVGGVCDPDPVGRALPAIPFIIHHSAFIILTALALLLLPRPLSAQQSHFWLQTDPATSRLGSVTNPVLNLRPGESSTLYLWFNDASAPHGFDGVRDLAAAFRRENGLPDDAPLPSDAVTRSASGLDPHISPANAEAQAARVARVRGLPESEVRKLVARFTWGRQLGLLGEPRVNVLLLNLALDREAALPR